MRDENTEGSGQDSGGNVGSDRRRRMFVETFLCDVLFLSGSSKTGAEE